jgi:hypothetical protein
MAKKNTKKTKKPARKPVTKKVKPIVNTAKSGSVWSGDGWDAAEGRTYSESSLPNYTLPTPEYTNPVPAEPSEMDRVVSQIEPYCKKYFKFSLIETVQFVKAKWHELKKFSQDNPVTFGIGFVCVFAALIALVAALD